MKSNQANTAGLTSAQQQCEMKSILAGSWPPLKPLPVFKYETVEYRARIDFDKKRGEWVCRKTSLASNEVQELRGGLSEITLALPHGEGETLSEGTEPLEQELEKDKQRRLQALSDWRENYENGARYFELREYLSENQRSELDASLRLSLTARQLQFNPKNVASVFDDLAIAGGRFATLIEFAKRNRAKLAAQEQEPGAQGTQVQGEEAVVDIAERCINADELPTLAIKNVLGEQEQISPAERTADIPPQDFEINALEIVDADAALIADDPVQEGRHSPAPSGSASKLGTHQPSPDRRIGSLRFPALEISGLQVAALFLFAALAFAVGLRAGYGSLASRNREAPNSMFTKTKKSATLPAQTAAADSRISTPAIEDSAITKKLEGQGAERFAEVRTTDSDSRPASESERAVKPEVDSARSDAIALSSHTAYRLSGAIGVATQMPKPSAILVSVPSRGEPFRVSSPIRAIAATSSFAMVSQLSFLVSPAAEPAEAHESARLEGGELVSFAWPRYSRPGTIRVRATIGELGQVLDVKFLSGSGTLLPATVRAVRGWRYRPTLLDKSAVRAQHDVTIEYRPRQYSAQRSSRRSSHNRN